jgi:hypothetical protein
MIILHQPILMLGIDAKITEPMNFAIRPQQIYYVDAYHNAVMLALSMPCDQLHHTRKDLFRLQSSMIKMPRSRATNVRTSVHNASPSD